MSDTSKVGAEQTNQAKYSKPAKPAVNEQPNLLIKPNGGEDVDGGAALTASLKSVEDGLKSGIVV